MNTSDPAKANRRPTKPGVGILLVALAFANAVGAQTKTEPLKFDVLTISESDPSYESLMKLVDERIQRYKSASVRRPQAIKYLVHYRARVRQAGPYWNRASVWATRAKETLASRGNVYDESGIVVVDGGVREAETLEFWFVSKGGELPKARPEFDRSEAIDCPSVIAYQSGLNFDKRYPVVLVAEARPTGADRYDWSVTDGKIVGGNGGSRAEVDVSGTSSDRLTAFLKVKGLPPPCDDTRTIEAFFGNTARMVDAFGPVANGDFKARLDAFFAELERHPEKQGYAYIYGDRSDRGRDVAARKRLLSSQIFFRGFDPKRIIVIDGGFREEHSTEFWIVPAGVDAPEPTPTVDRRFVLPIASPRRNK